MFDALRNFAGFASCQGPAGVRLVLTVLVGALLLRRVAERAIRRRLGEGRVGGELAEAGLDDRYSAYWLRKMKHDELPVKRGYPVRLVVPGLYGYVSATKWLTEIEFTDRDSGAYWIKRGWAKKDPIKTQPRIDTIKPGVTLLAGSVGGVAWASTGGVDLARRPARRPARRRPLGRQYVCTWGAKPGEHTLRIRATDGEGESQIEEETASIPSGATGCHTVEVTVT